MHRVSLVVCTLGERPEDLRALLRSLEPQVSCLREIIIVDQHADATRVPKLLDAHRSTLPIRHTRSEKGLSRARNHGLTLVTGSLVAFPDDDCVYPAGLLHWVTQWFDANREYSILAVGVKDAEGIPSGNRWVQSACDIRPMNAFRTTFSSSLFLRKELAKRAEFDPRLGVGSGTPYGSGEETDYVLRLLSTGAKGRFDRTKNIVHPRRDMLSGTSSATRATSYGFGMGHLLRRHSLTTLWASFVTYNTARAGLALMTGKGEGARMCLAQTKGIWNGYRAVPVLELERNKDRAPELHVSNGNSAVRPIAR